MPDPVESYYDLLNVRRDASPQEITAAYRRLAKVLHPDVCSDPAAEELFKSVNEAYQVLRDEKKREAYDLSLLEAWGSEYGEYYTGKTRYRDPRTWYYA
ncbi:MAG: DnaJ domain-containing protein, partial [Methanospirillum sp.]|nr:DnaJ domain-containing protein [Methanospirillum sp.]